MATSYSTPRTVTDGLVFNLDAANAKSYPGSGTTWNDLSRQDINGTLTNGPTFNNLNGGSILFDGSNDFVECGTNSTVTFSGNFTIGIWMNAVTFANTRILLQKATTSASPNGFINYQFEFLNVSGGTANIRLYMQSDQFDNGAAQGGTLSTNTWYYITGTRTGNTLNIYYNGVLSGTGAAPTTGTITGPTVNFSTTNLRFADTVGTRASSPFNGYISNVHMYNRVLSVTEILQNFNATRRRFGV